MIKLKYSEISSFAFAQAVQKISSTPTHGQKASLIHKVTKQLGFIRENISKEYQADIVQVYGKKDAEGKIIRPAGEPNGFEPVEETQEAFEKAQEAFGDRTAELNVNPMTLELLSDMKVSAQDLEALRGLYAGNSDDAQNGPGVPTNVASIR